MNREVHVRFCESVGVKFPRATRPLIHTFALEIPLQYFGASLENAEFLTPLFFFPIFGAELLVVKV